MRAACAAALRAWTDPARARRSGKIAPIFFNTMEDAGALPIEMDVSKMAMGDVIDIYPYEGVVKSNATDAVVSEFKLKTEARPRRPTPPSVPPGGSTGRLAGRARWGAAERGHCAQVLLDEVRAGGRIPLIIGRGLTARARVARPAAVGRRSGCRTAARHEAQGLHARAEDGGQGVRRRTAVLPGHVLRAEDDDGRVAGHDRPDDARRAQGPRVPRASRRPRDAVFCHTAAYPKPVDVITHHTLPDFIRNRGGVSLRPGDGIIHSWLNRMLLPDTVGTGGDSHTRFPIGISFPAGSGLVAFARGDGRHAARHARVGARALHGHDAAGHHAARPRARDPVRRPSSAGCSRSRSRARRTSSRGRILEIEGLGHLKCEQAFELSDASAERSPRGAPSSSTRARSRVPDEQHRRCSSG